jgi:hypothetical protein
MSDAHVLSPISSWSPQTNTVNHAKANFLIVNTIPGGYIEGAIARFSP